MKGVIEIFPAEYGRNVWRVVTPDSLEEVCELSYWVHVAKQLKMWDRIEVCAFDGSYYAVLMVLSAGDKWAKVTVLNKYKLIAMKKPVKGYIVSHTQGMKWRVQRSEDKEVLSKDHETKELADQWLANYKDMMEI